MQCLVSSQRCVCTLSDFALVLFLFVLSFSLDCNGEHCLCRHCLFTGIALASIALSSIAFAGTVFAGIAFARIALSSIAFAGIALTHDIDDDFFSANREQ